ncbi:hypothetical protein OK016_19595 [Vibrio chagasii]|nr:hypothetical protein [Vibrio chagasii]
MNFLKAGRSVKTNKEYLAACSQFPQILKADESSTQINPFEDVKIQKKANSNVLDEQRARWSLTDMKRFFNHPISWKKMKRVSKVDFEILLPIGIIFRGGLSASNYRYQDKKNGIDYFRFQSMKKASM